MIKVVFYINKIGDIQGYTVKGHSNYGEYGKDIVCSAISILAQTALMSVVSVCNIPENEIDYKISDGFLELDMPKILDYNNKNEIQIVMKTLEVGIKSIIENYPEYVTLKYREV